MPIIQLCKAFEFCVPASNASVAISFWVKLQLVVTTEALSCPPRPVSHLKIMK
jgi:hypothetical protein